MTYTLIGRKDYISEEIKKITKNEKNNVVEYSLPETPIKIIIEQLQSLSMFGQKIIIITNIDKLENQDLLMKYLENQGENILILVAYKELDNRKKITKLIKEKTTYKEVFNYDLEKLIIANLEDYQMKIQDINLLINYCEENLFRIKNELEKLKLYKTKEKLITKEDIQKLVKKSPESTIFNLIDAINEKNKEDIFKIYEELIEEGETKEKILYTIASHYRLLFQIKTKLKTKSETEIVKEYKMHPYRLTKLKEQTYFIEEKQILKILKNLSDIDIDIKSGTKDISTSMVLFFKNL